MERPWLQLLVIMFIMALDLGYAVWNTYTVPETTVSVPHTWLPLFIHEILNI